MKAFRHSIGIALGVAIGYCVLAVHPVFASGLQFTSVGTHPQVVAQPTAWGREIGDMQFDTSGNILVGYGDWNVNTGPIAVNPFNTSSNTFAGQQLSIPTESVQAVRSINGKLYMAWTDPRGSWTTPTSGFSTNASGSWQNVGNLTAVHLFDMDSLGGTDLWMVGSVESSSGGASISEAVAWRSSDGGQTWNKVYSDADTPASAGNGFERYYWVRVLNGKVYMQAHEVSPQPPIRVYDPATNSWSNGPSEELCGTYQTNRIEVFDGRILCATSNKIRSFNGTTIGEISSYNGGSINDFYVDGSTFYVVDNQGYVYSTTDLNTWKIVAAVPTDSTYGAPKSVAVRNNQMYIGTTNSQILAATTLIDSSTELTPTIESLTPNTLMQNTGSLEVRIQGRDFLKNSIATIGDIQLTDATVSPGEVKGVLDTSALSPGTYDVTVTQPNGTVTTLTESFELTAYQAPEITGVSMTKDTLGNTILHVRGTNLLGYLKANSDDSSAYIVGFSNNLVNVNGENLPFCVEGDMTSIYSTNTKYYSTDPPCYRIMDYDASTGIMRSLMTDTGFDVVMGKNFAITTPGTVQLIGGSSGNMRIDESNVYSFNSIPTGGAPITPSAPVKVSKKTLTLSDLELASTGVSPIAWVIGAIALLVGGNIAMFIYSRRS